jgi:hypothetical protein
MTTIRRYAVAGALAGVVWRGVEPGLRRVFGHPYSDAQIVTAFVTRGPAQPVLDYSVQACGGAAFGALFARLGGREPVAATVAALAENVALMPLFPVIDRVHPDVRDGTWPPLTANPRAAAVSLSGHAVFGVLLGWFGRRFRSG